MRRSPTTGICESRALIASCPPFHSSSSIAPLFFLSPCVSFFYSLLLSPKSFSSRHVRRDGRRIAEGKAQWTAERTDAPSGGKPRRDGETSDVLVLGQPRVSFQSAERTLTHTVAQLEGEHMGNLRPPKQRKLTQQDIGFCFHCKCHTVFLDK